MKTILTGAAVSALALALSAQSFAAELPNLDGRTIHAVTENAYYPLNFADPKTGDGIGLEYDVINEVAKRLNAKIEWDLSAWDVMIEAVRSGQFDIGADGITITEERDEVIDFTDPFITVEQYLLVRADEERITGAESFAENADLLFGAQAGTSSFYTAIYDVLDGDEANPRVKTFDSFGAAVQAVKAGDVDAIIADQAAATGYMGADPGAFKQIDETLKSDPLGFILTPRSDLVEPFNAALDSMREDGWLDERINYWFFEYAAE
ncbi:transporter substrate-binding domain-containing protein [Devosia sp. MC521]|uniref:substrate-binding periplasmic protein n=1 Tax=Devosia sp. MC521 TaxID=2759954 RepID=UPI0015F78A58|nr:transporter substrate-binding domain-containing protein [Devosia sp. MC521]MBJ6987222.1 amino acid ABC transporter substrate-binding protein [Devosia sp. MC521]QMW62834.1 amino acid ABC transporter substrate-binding protein [Devosia sp. MC521]